MAACSSACDKNGSAKADSVVVSVVGFVHCLTNIQWKTGNPVPDQPCAALPLQLRQPEEIQDTKLGLLSDLRLIRRYNIIHKMKNTKQKIEGC